MRTCNCANHTINDEESQDQYCKEVYDLISAISILEVYILDIINRYKISDTTLNIIWDLLSNFSDNSIDTTNKIIEKQYTYGTTNEKSYSINRELSIAEMSIVTELTEQFETEINLMVNNIYLYLNALILGAISESSTENRTRNYYRVLLNIKNEGIIAHVDNMGKNWQISTYGSMLSKTFARQSTNLGNLFQDPSHDLYRVSSHDGACPICIPLEGRVFSRDSISEYFPSIGMLFGKKNPDLPYSLSNSWLNIHPNCLHVLEKFNADEYTQAELDDIIRYSSFTENPIDHGSKFQKQMHAYRKTQKNNIKRLKDSRQFREYKAILGNTIPNNLNSFLNIKYTEPDTYRVWLNLYKSKLKDIRDKI